MTNFLVPYITSTKRISTSKCDIGILRLILTLFVLQTSWHFWAIVGSILFVLQNSWYFWTIVGSILFVLQNSWHFQMTEEYGRIYFLWIFLDFFWNSFGILWKFFGNLFSIFKVSELFTLLKSADCLHC